MGAVQSGNARGVVEGAAGAVIGETIGEEFSKRFLPNDGADLSTEDYERRKELGIQLAKLGSAAGALVMKTNPDIMLTTSENAVKNNVFFIPVLIWVGVGGVVA